MEVSEQNITALSNYLRQTMSPDPAVRKPAEDFLKSVEANKGYPLLLLELLTREKEEPQIRVSAGITFKNYIKRNWRVPPDHDDLIDEKDRLTIKQQIVDLMLRSPEQIQRQLSDAISIIGREDFPDKWPNLIQDMVNYFASRDFHIINGILRTAHSIFKRYRHEFKSQALWTEIKFVLDNFAQPLQLLFEATMKLAREHASDANALKVVFSSLVLICKIFYSLNFQDLPEFFEDNMKFWMENFLVLLTSDNKILKTEDEEEAGLLEQVKSQICDNIALYAQKYDEEFQEHMPTFLEAVRHLLVTTDEKMKYDLLVSNAIQFLASVAERPRNKELFADPEALAGICGNVIVPNMRFRVSDEELFEDNPEEYIRRDIEGSDVDTRRRAASDLVKALSSMHEEVIIQLFTQYVQQMLAEYSQNPTQNWKQKDVAIYLVTSLAAKAQTQKHGITQTSALVNIGEFYKAHILPDLQATDVNERPLLKADAIKFVMTFRNQLTKDDLVQCIPLLANHLTANSIVCHSYAAHCVERLFTVRNATGGPAISRDEILGSIQKLLENLFSAMEKEGSQENEYVMKAIMRTISLLQGSVVDFVGIIMKQLMAKLMLVCKNPSKPHFNHYLFETLCVSIRNTCKATPEALCHFEECLFPAFERILGEDVQEFCPYVFQILSIMLENHKGAVDTYMNVFPHLLVPILWDRPGNIPPLIRLLQAYIEKASPLIEDEKIKGLLGVFQKLLASKTNDHEGFYLLNSMIEFMGLERITPARVKQVFVLLFTRLTSSKTTKYVKSLLVFFSLFAIKCSATTLIEIIDSVQPKLFAMVLERLFILEVQKVSGNMEKKICAVGITLILTEAPAMITQYENLWVPLLQALIGLFELPEDDTVPDDEHFIEIEDTPGYQTAYSKLMFAGKKVHDPCANVSDMKGQLAKNLQKLSIGHPGKLTPMITSGLQPEAAQFLQHYMQATNVTLV
ncbi:exportin-2-like [Lineus longissimus]|uniref:exportin-2-like n=1 Tax=Lineus longissimus TaxID=88925 RepID=UPI002B4C882F